MVYFQCATCINSLKKNQIEKHFAFQCRQANTFSCLTCHQHFDRFSYKDHTSCITEDEKYKMGDAEFKNRNTKSVKPVVLNGTVDIEGIKWSGMRKTTKVLLKKTHKKNLKITDLVNYLIDIFAKFKEVNKEDVDAEYFEKSLRNKLMLEKSLVINNNVVFYI